MKVTRLNSVLTGKCESVRQLMNESVSEFKDVPSLMCVDRKRSECGTERVRGRLMKELGKNLKKNVGWSRWELVKYGEVF